MVFILLFYCRHANNAVKSLPLKVNKGILSFFMTFVVVENFRKHSFYRYYILIYHLIKQRIFYKNIKNRKIINCSMYVKLENNILAF